MPAQVSRASEDREKIPVSIPRAAARLIGRAASRRHKSKSAFIRDAAVAEANRVLGIEPAPATTTQETEAASAAA